MKALPVALFLLFASAASPALGQPAADPAPSETAVSDAQAAFEKLKSLAGSWVGQLDMGPGADEFNGRLAQFSIRVTSRGNALVHELSLSGIPDHPVTVFYLEGDRLMATHYCDAGNRPRFVGTLSPDGTRLEFAFLDLSGPEEHGHMHNIAFTFGDENGHTEEWTYMMPGDNPARGQFELQRTNFQD
jgi:hypothetical protein